jgi:hypothetical protein
MCLQDLYSKTIASALPPRRRRPSPVHFRFRVPTRQLKPVVLPCSQAMPVNPRRSWLGISTSSPHRAIVIFATMKTFFVLASLAASALGQRLHIVSPFYGEPVHPRKTLTIELEQDVCCSHSSLCKSYFPIAFPQ